ncbi:MAG: hypothetical protein IPM81_08270 [Saprospirales bacterium]|nr:hypothetical protein [Saprospirales bacterium]
MPDQKIHRSLWLIIASLTCLGAFEALWLRKVYKEQYDRLSQETEYLFQQTIMALQDSLVRRSLVHTNSGTDNLYPAPAIPDFLTATRRNAFPPPYLQDSAVRQLKSNTKMVVRVGTEDNSKHHPPDSMRYDQVVVFIAASDSAAPVPGGGMDRLLLHLPERLTGVKGNDHFFRIEKNTLPITELQKRYRERLASAGITLPFEIIHSDALPLSWVSGGITTRPAPAGLLAHRFYAANFSDYRAYLWRQMTPSAAFAFFVFGITLAAFLQIYRSLRQQQRLARLKSEFISNITHELKTPITTVGVALEALSDFDALHNPEKTRAYLAHSKRELDRLSLLVEKVLRLSMFEEQEPQLKLEPLQMAPMVRQVIDAMALQAERAGATVQLQLPADVSALTVNGDRIHLAGVVFNLLDNALKYAADQPFVQVSLENTPAAVRLQVRDNGAGIPPEYQSKIFNKFFRLPSGNQHNVKGHGLGLSYAAQVVRQHGGRIWVERAEREAACLSWISLPLKLHR